MSLPINRIQTLRTLGDYPRRYMVWVYATGSPGMDPKQFNIDLCHEIRT